MRPSGVFRPKTSVRFRRVADEGVVLLQEAGEVLALNEVATRILEHIVDGASVEAIVELLSEEYDIDRTVLESDVAGYVQELVDGNVIEAGQIGPGGPDGL